MRKRKLALDEFYTVDEAAEMVRCNRELLYKAIRAGELKTYRAGSAIRATGKQVLDWLERGGSTKARASDAA